MLPLHRAHSFLLYITGIICAVCLITTGQAAPLSMICVETVWCDIAHQIGGTTLDTASLITAEGIDPHHIQPSPSMAREIAHSDALLVNGAAYDDWALNLAPNTTQRFVASQQKGWHEGDDPHLFFDPNTVQKMAHAIAQWIIKKHPADQSVIKNNLAQFDQTIAKIKDHLHHIDATYHNTPIAMTEPSGEILLEHAGLTPINQHWARAIMNESGVSAQETALLEKAIQKRTIHLLIKNAAITAPQASTMEDNATQAKIPVLSIGETLPSHSSWQEWITAILNMIEYDLKRSSTVQ